MDQESRGKSEYTNDGRELPPTISNTGVPQRIPTYGVRMSADWEVIGYVISSTYRVQVLRRLDESPAPPSTIAEDTGCAISHVSRALQDLREHGLVDLLVSESRKKGRIYGMTDAGREIWDMIESQNLH